MRGAERAVRAAGVVALVLLATLPLLPVLSRRWPPAAALEHLANAWFEIHCERDPARALSLAGTRLAVCARCSGIYFGLGIGAALRWPSLSPPRVRLWLACATAAMLVDVLLERLGVHGSWPGVRLLSGVLLAYPVGVGLAESVALPRSNAAGHRP